MENSAKVLCFAIKTVDFFIETGLAGNFRSRIVYERSRGGRIVFKKSGAKLEHCRARFARVH